MSTEPTFRLTVVPLASDPRPVATRLRLAIKYLLRAQALRLVSIEELDPPPHTPAQPKNGGAGVAPPLGGHEQ